MVLEYLLTVIVCTAPGVCGVGTNVLPSEEACAQSLRAVGEVWLALLTPNRNARVWASCTPHKPT